MAISTQTQHRIKSGMTLLAASELGARIVKKIAGNDISTSINSRSASKEVIQQLLLQRITSRLLQRQTAAR